MDQAFFKRGFAGAEPVGVDYDALVAALRIGQQGTPTARAARQSASANALAAVVLSDTNWRESAAALGGSFHVEQRARTCAAPSSTQMTRPFTLGFQPSFKAGELWPLKQEQNVPGSTGKA